MEKNNVRKEVGRIKEASQVTGISVSQIWQLVKENKIESYLPSPKIRLINFESLFNYIKYNNSGAKNEQQ